MFKFASKASILTLSIVALISMGMPIEAQARGNGEHQKGARPAASKNNKVPNRNNNNKNDHRKNNNNIKNTNISNNNVNVNVDHNGGYRHGDRYDNNYHPVATAVAVTAAVAVTSAVIGSIVNANQMPSNCIQVMRGNGAYMQCGSTWYQPQYQGSNVTYIVVNQPY
ncbi:hypothetical protein [uncultured Deefgea sp.]|uniref:hypothetical protein n=1 Tax=uncultured Deefgea sp. TaxID=1304914 RepID=UPI00259A0369|nr:hypothetical protein [uncultured Deefgea sp.]